MASVVNDRNGWKRISFPGLDRKRRSLRLGVVDDAEARTIADHVGVILDAARAGVVLDGCDAAELLRLAPDLQTRAMRTAGWITKLPDELRAKLATAGLVRAVDQAEEIATPTLGEFLDAYLKRRTDSKPGTIVFYGHTASNLRWFQNPLDDVRSPEFLEDSKTPTGF
jgi:hypothetical protein